MAVVIVGASLAGLRTAEALRARSYGESITLVGAEPGLPYDRPPLSKQYLAQEHLAQTPLLRDADAFGELDVDLRANTRATCLNPERRRVSLSDGDELEYDHIVIATGANARTVPLGDGLLGIVLWRFVSLFVAGSAWSLLFDPERRPGRFITFIARWVSEKREARGGADAGAAAKAMGKGKSSPKGTKGTRGPCRAVVPLPTFGGLRVPRPPSSFLGALTIFLSLGRAVAAQGAGVLSRNAIFGDIIPPFEGRRSSRNSRGVGPLSILVQRARRR